MTCFLKCSTMSQDASSRVATDQSNLVPVREALLLPLRNNTATK